MENTLPKEVEQPAEVQEVIRLVRQAYPNVKWTRLWVSHPGADDGLWFFRLPNVAGEVQIESIFGICSFIVETDKYNEFYIGNSVLEVASKVREWLALPDGSAESY